MPTEVWTLLAPFTDPASRTHWLALLTGALLAAVFLFWVSERRDLKTLAKIPSQLLPVRYLRHPSVALDVQLLMAHQLLSVLITAPVWAGSWYLATHLTRLLDGAVGVPNLGVESGWMLSIAFSLTLFVVWDASRWALHWCVHRVPALWALHQVHHSAEVLTPLSFHRVHPLESLLFQARAAIVTGTLSGLFFWAFRGAATDITVLGVHAIGLVMNLTHGNLRHSPVWLGFPDVVERWFISPAQHQVHHSADAAEQRCNYGTWLAVWDRMAGTLRLSGDQPPATLGLAAGERNHGNDLVSAWFGPLLDVLGLRRLLPVLALVIPFSAQAADDEEAAELTALGEEIIVYSPDGTPRVAGSAHVVDEEQLEQFEYDDVHRILNKVPGVYVRGEDGFGLRPNIGIRGANSDRSAKITLLEDGVLLGPAPYAAPAAYYFPLATRLVGVEVFKGPAAITHGPQTVGGAINLRTRDVPTQTDAAFDLAYGMRRTAKLHAWTGTGNERAGVLIEGVRLTSGGFKELDGGGPTGFDRTEWMLKGRLATDPALKLSQSLALKLGYSSERSNETYLGLSVADYAENPYRRYAASAEGLMDWKRTQAELAWSFDIGQVRARTVAYHHYLTRGWRKLNAFSDGTDLHDLLQNPEGGASAVYLGILRGDEDTATDSQNLLIGTNDRRFQAGGLQTTVNWQTRMVNGVQSTLETGVRIHHDDVKRLHTEDTYAMIGGRLNQLDVPTQTTLDSDATATAIAAHLQDDVQVGAVHILPGARVESIHTERVDVGGPLSPADRRTILLPGLGLLWSAMGDVNLFSGVYRGFSPVPPGSLASVTPETAWNWEAGARLGGSGQWHGELVGYYNDYQNLSGQCTSSGGCTQEQLDQQFDAGQVRIVGLEAVAAQEFLLPHRMRLPIEATYTYTSSVFMTSFNSEFPQFGSVDAGDRLPYVPSHQGALRASLSHPRWRVGAVATHRSGMDDIAGGGPPENPAVPALTQLDVAADMQLTKHWAMYTNGTNLLANQSVVSWRPFGARPTAPFQVMVGIKLTPPE